MPEARADTTAAGAAHEQQRAAGPHLAAGVARDLELQHQVLGDCVAQLIGVHLEQGPVVRAARCDQDMVDRVGQAVEELLQRS
jgi:hypothetical protein